MPDDPTISICVCTYRRPTWLARLLDSIDAQVFRDERPRVEVIVADNDPERSAAGVVSARDGVWPVRYVHVPTRGIAPARNASIRGASATSEWIVFIDDDEHASPTWLDELLRFQRAHGCDVVTGPVVGELPEGAPAWIERGGFFQRRRFPTGATRDRAFTNNTLVRAAIIRSDAPVFNETRALHGGEDTLVFRRLHARGHEIRWCDEAVVYESIPKSRARAGWILRRAFRLGTAATYMERRLRGPISGRARVVCIALVRGAQGLLLLLPSLLIGKHAVVRQIRWIVYATGLLVGTTGYDHDEYRHGHHGV